jgi:hypothetical protein
MSISKILLNDLLQIQDLERTRVRFILMAEGNWDPVKFFRNRELEPLIDALYWNYSNKSFALGQTVIGLVRICAKEGLWLLLSVGRVTKDLGRKNAVGYEFTQVTRYEKYFGRVVVRFKNRSQALIRKGSSVLSHCEVEQVLVSPYDDDAFPGYEKVSLSWEDLRRVLHKPTWRTALQNQKAVYLVTDASNNKMYVGAAYGLDMLLGRWAAYVENGHGGNVELKKLGFDHIRKSFRYSILDVFRSTADDRLVLERESWWKTILQTRDFGYNKN